MLGSNPRVQENLGNYGQGWLLSIRVCDRRWVSTYK